MLNYLALALFLFVIIHLSVKAFARLPVKNVRYLGTGLLVLLGVAMVLLLLRLGQVHMASLLGGLMFLMPFLQRLRTLLGIYPQVKAAKDQWQRRQKGAAPTSDMSLQEAQSILDVGPDATKTEINTAYKALMRTHHPDQGGNAYFAERINAAREILLRHAGK